MATEKMIRNLAKELATLVEHIDKEAGKKGVDEVSFTPSNPENKSKKKNSPRGA